MFDNLPPFSRTIDNAEIHLANQVQLNSIFVVGIKDKTNVVPTIMSLYSSDGKYRHTSSVHIRSLTEERYPEPHQIMFCQPETKWEEINLLLLRCFYHYKIGLESPLFSIVNVEYQSYIVRCEQILDFLRYLDFNTQSKLVNATISLSKSERGSFRLALFVYP